MSALSAVESMSCQSWNILTHNTHKKVDLLSPVGGSTPTKWIT